MQRRTPVTVAWRSATIGVPLLLPLLWAATTLFQLSIGTVFTCEAVLAFRRQTVQSSAGTVDWALLRGRAGIDRGSCHARWFMRILGLDLSLQMAARRADHVWSCERFWHGVRVWLAACIAAWPFRPGYRLVIWTESASLLVLLAGALVALVNPSRGIQDRLAGTFIVPR